MHKGVTLSSGSTVPAQRAVHYRVALTQRLVVQPWRQQQLTSSSEDKDACWIVVQSGQKIQCPLASNPSRLDLALLVKAPGHLQASAQSRHNIRYSLIQAVSQEEPSDRKPDPWPLLMAGHAQLKFVMTECSKTQIRLTRPKCFQPC